MSERLSLVKVYPVWQQAKLLISETHGPDLVLGLQQRQEGVSTGELDLQIWTCSVHEISARSMTWMLDPANRRRSGTWTVRRAGQAVFLLETAATTESDPAGKAKDVMREVLREIGSSINWRQPSSTPFEERLRKSSCFGWGYHFLAHISTKRWFDWNNVDPEPVTTASLTAATAVSAFGALLLKDRCVVRAVTLKGMTGHREADCFRITDRTTGNGRAADKLRAAATFLQETVIV